MTLHLMPPDGWRKRVEQLGLGFQLRGPEPESPTLEAAAERGVGATIDPNGAGRAGADTRAGREETKYECGCG